MNEIESQIMIIQTFYTLTLFIKNKNSSNDRMDKFHNKKSQGEKEHGFVFERILTY